MIKEIFGGFQSFAILENINLLITQYNIKKINGSVTKVGPNFSRFDSPRVRKCRTFPLFKKFASGCNAVN